MVYKHRLLVVSVPKSAPFSTLNQLKGVTEWVIPHNNTTLSLKLFHQEPTWIVVQVIYDEDTRNASFEGISHLLKGDASHHLMVHIIRSYQHMVLGFVYSAPELVPQLIRVV